MTETTKKSLTSLAVTLEPGESENDQFAAKLQQGLSDFPEDLKAFLGRLMLLYGLPLDYLIPAGRMLPPHSLRTFIVDNNWLYSLIDGALSTGVHTGRDIELQRLLAPIVRLASTKAAANMRARFREFTAETFSADSDATWSGFFLRSPLVSGWPGLEIIAEDQDGNKLPLLRLERLSPDILFALYQGKPAKIILREPAEGLHFGISDQEIPLLSPRDPLTGIAKNDDLNTEEIEAFPVNRVPWRGWENVELDQLKEDLETLVESLAAQANGTVDTSAIEEQLRAQLSAAEEHGAGAIDLLAVEKLIEDLIETLSAAEEHDTGTAGASAMARQIEALEAQLSVSKEELLELKAHGVIDIVELKNRYEKNLSTNSMGAGGFALQMIETAQRIIINIE
jgi:hypothetical protein